MSIIATQFVSYLIIPELGVLMLLSHDFWTCVSKCSFLCFQRFWKWSFQKSSPFPNLVLTLFQATKTSKYCALWLNRKFYLHIKDWESKRKKWFHLKIWQPKLSKFFLLHSIHLFRCSIPSPLVFNYNSIKSRWPSIFKGFFFSLRYLLIRIFISK